MRSRPAARLTARCGAQLSTRTDFVLTGSADGHLKFWKRKADGVEFVKHYRSHPGAIVSMAGAWPWLGAAIRHADAR